MPGRHHAPAPIGIGLPTANMEMLIAAPARAKSSPFSSI
jgi:hypothetical protein